ncbi:pimeloyl-ACP methyl ester carboxylesterase [Peribacillus deserti]|uniref:Pimeloyl-ACP methyl ester carboxylesterase n=1 Tax=Peribacillus deserti TaxID=673318 RepID=A0ABS2QNL8_9BACI|nr:alpha/beta fold hydrolase [Peribacillus deserti]MBM7693866.1 pimeloyl-ACP methyl ester carboxylesterase [Peribacillus deserti]
MGRSQITIPWRDSSLSAALDVPDDYVSHSRLPLVIICHGFIGSKTGVDRLFVKAAEKLTAENFAVLRFDYYGCGESPGQYGDTGLCDLIDQTQRVIDYSLSLNFIDTERVFLLGHSLGGAASVLALESESRINKLILWSAVGFPYKDITSILGSDEVLNLMEGETIEYSGYHFTRKYIDSLLKHSPVDSLKKFQGDALIIHGSDDDVIPCKYSLLYKDIIKNSEIHIVEGANHTYSSSCHFNGLIMTTIDWLNKAEKNNSTVS